MLTKVTNYTVYKYLGILLSKDLSWSPHVGGICAKPPSARFLICSTEGSTSSQTQTLFTNYIPLLSDLIWSMPVVFGYPTPQEISMLSKVYRSLPVNWQVTDGMATPTKNC